MEKEIYAILSNFANTTPFVIDDQNEVFPSILYIPLNETSTIIYDDKENGKKQYYMIHLFTNGFDVGAKEDLKEQIETLNEVYDVSIANIQYQKEETKTLSNGDVVDIYRFMFNVEISNVS